MKDYEIKIDGEKSQFDGGAIRYKKNKGRMDLIPEGPLQVIINHIENNCTCHKDWYDLTKACILSSDKIMSSDVQNKALADVIVNLIALHHYRDEGHMVDHPYAYMLIRDEIPKMLLELSVHFQKGAEAYGEHNCEKGIPLWSFIDSGKRHMMQYITEADDGENHYIAAIWNFWMAIWTNLPDDSKSKYLSDEKPKEDKTEEKPDQKSQTIGEILTALLSKPEAPDRIITQADEIAMHNALFSTTGTSIEEYDNRSVATRIMRSEPKIWEWLLEYYSIDKRKLSWEVRQEMFAIAGSIWKNFYLRNKESKEPYCAKTWLMEIVKDPNNKMGRFVDDCHLSRKK